MRVPDRQAVRTIVREKMSRLRALITVLCVLSLATSIVFAPRPALAALAAQQLHEAVAAVSYAAGAKKPCERTGLRAGIACNVGAVIGFTSGGAHLIEPSCRTAGVAPFSRSHLAAPCTAGSLFRPPRVAA